MSPFDRATKLLAIVLSLSLTPAIARAQSADPGKLQAQANLREGNALLEQGRPADALQKFNEAYRLFPSPKLHYNIGQAQSLIPGHEAPAYEAMSLFLNDAKDANPELRAAAETQRQRLRAKVGLVSVSIDPPDAELIVDDIVVGKGTPENPLVLGIGQHKVAIKKDARTSAAESITIAGGDTSAVRLNLAPPVAPPPVVAAPPVIVPAPVITPPPALAVAATPAPAFIPSNRGVSADGGYWTRRHKIGAALFAVGAASLVFGLVEHIRYFGTADDFRKAGCGTNDLSVGSNCQGVNDQFKSAQIGWIAGYLGAAALGGTGAYFLWIAPAESTGPTESGAAVSMNPGMTINFEKRF